MEKLNSLREESKRIRKCKLLISKKSINLSNSQLKVKLLFKNQLKLKNKKYNCKLLRIKPKI